MTRDAANLRVRGAVTTVLVMLLAVMIVRDILVRRWGSPSAAPGVTSRSSYDSEKLSPPHP